MILIVESQAWGNSKGHSHAQGTFAGTLVTVREVLVDAASQVRQLLEPKQAPKQTGTNMPNVSIFILKTIRFDPFLGAALSGLKNANAKRRVF